MPTSDVSEIITRSSDIRQTYGARDSMYDSLDNMIFFTPEDMPDAKWIKETISPIALNKLTGAWRLLVATDPYISVPFDENDLKTQKASSDLEIFAKLMLAESGKIRQRPVHYDAAWQALQYAEIHIALIETANLVKSSEGKAKARFEEIASRTPILFEPLPVRTGYMETDLSGLISYHQYRQVRAGWIKSQYGKDAAKPLGSTGDSELVYITDWWDLDNHLVFLDTGELMNGSDVKNPYPFIPIAAAVAEVPLYVESDRSRRPFLYGLWKSKLYDRISLSMTLYYSMLFAIGSNALFLYKANSPGKTAPYIDTSGPANTIVIERDEDYGSLAKQVIDPSIPQSIELSRKEIDESTIYDQTLGQSLGANATFSSTALLSQMGRLPLIPYQKALETVTGDALTKALKMVKLGNKQVKSLSGGKSVALKPAQIPDVFSLEAKYDVAMPQDERQNLELATKSSTGQEPLIPKRLAREKYLKEGQSDKLQAEIWAEQMADLQSKITMQQTIQQSQPQPQGAPGQTPPQAPPQQPPPEQTQLQQGMPLTQPQPPPNQPSETMPPMGGG